MSLIGVFASIMSFVATTLVGVIWYIIKQKDKDQSQQWKEIRDLQDNSAKQQNLTNLEQKLEAQTKEIREAHERHYEELRKSIGSMIDKIGPTVDSAVTSAVQGINGQIVLLVELIKKNGK